MKKIIIVSGWASPKESLQKLSDACSVFSDVLMVSIHDLSSGYATGLVDIINDAGGNCLLVGWSTGGMAVLEAAVHCQNKIDGMILISAASRFTSCKDYDLGTSPSVLRAMISGIKKDARTTLINFLINTHKPFVEDMDSLEREADASCLIGNEELIKGLRYLQDTDLRDLLGNIKIPAVVIHGKEDSIIPWQAGRFLSERLPKASFKLIERVGHDLPIRFFGSIVKEVRRFMKTI
ncbi:MAG: alpha/beta fold hydrolase [Nitrospirae bacterium]|nr:alpha/beta fold hydrolase [Nitrospirota bacterium]